MPMAGVGGVKVAPEYRGRGVGRALMNGLIPELVTRGFPVSTLYPATAPLYRSLGWELAGGRYETTVPMQALARLVAPDQAATGQAAGGSGAGSSAVPAGLRRATAADAAVVADTVGQVYGSLGDCGPATFDLGSVADWLDDDNHLAYLAGDGFLSYRWANVHESMRVEVLAAASASTARAFWQLLASHGTMADEVRACLAPDDPVSWLIAEPVAAVRQAWKWMLRLVDVPAAVAARGFPAGVEASVLLEVADDQLPANTGRWRLQVSDGSGKIARVGPLAPAGDSSPVLRLGARGIAALYAGLPLTTLRRAGLAAGGDQAGDGALDSAFGCRPAFMVHDF